MRSTVEQAMDNTLDYTTFDTQQLAQLDTVLSATGFALQCERSAYPERYVRRVFKAIKAARWCIASELHARGC